MDIFVIRVAGNVCDVDEIGSIEYGLAHVHTNSPATRNLVKSGTAKVVGAIYDVSTGKIEWLPDAKVDYILKTVEANSARAMEAMAS